MDKQKINELLEDIELDKQIDPDALDVEWVEQSNLFYKYSSTLDDLTNEKNEKKKEMEDEKDELDRIRSLIELEIRENPKNFIDVERATDSSVKAAALQDARYIDQLSTLNEKKTELNEIQNYVNRFYTCTNTMQEKKAALERLCYLISVEYISVPCIPRELRKELKKYRKDKEKTKRIQREAKEKIKKRNRNKNDNGKNF